MRVTCVIHSLSGGGAERLMAGLISRMVENHSVSLITLDCSSNDRYSVSSRVRRVALDLMSQSRSAFHAAFANFRRIKQLRRAIVEERPDVVLSFCDKTNVLALLATMTLRIPTVFSEHTQPAYQDLGIVWHRLRQFAYPSAAAGIVLTKDARKVVGQWTDCELTIIPPAVDAVPDDHPQYDAESRRSAIVSIGRLSKEKQLDLLIKAFSMLPKSLDHWTLELYGEGERRASLESLISNLNLNDRVHLMGWCADVWSVHKDAAVFAMTSQYEGFPVALLEAMAAGTPAISLDCESGPREVIDSGQNGLLVPKGSEQLFADGLEQLLNDQNLRNRISIRSKDVAQTYSWKRFVDAHERLLVQVAQAN